MKATATIRTDKTIKIELDQADVLTAIKNWLNVDSPKFLNFNWDDLDWNIHGHDEEFLRDDPCVTITIVETTHDQT